MMWYTYWRQYLLAYWPMPFMELLTVFFIVHSPSTCIFYSYIYFPFFSYLCLSLFKYASILQFIVLCKNLSFLSGHYYTSIPFSTFLPLVEIDTSTVTGTAVRNPWPSDTAPYVLRTRLCYKVPTSEYP